MLLSLDEITKCFTEPGGAGRITALDRIRLDVEEGETIAVTGPSGSGKSTLLHLIALLDRPDQGTLRFRGEDMSTWDETAASRFRNREVGIVFQQHHLLPQCTALENVLLSALAQGTPDTTMIKHADHLLAEVGLADRSRHRPGELSGGQCQRVALARALLQSPPLLLADEPTGSLDAENARALVQTMLDLNARMGTALIVVTHDPDVARKMNRQYRLTAGRLVPTTHAP